MKVQVEEEATWYWKKGEKRGEKMEKQRGMQPPSMPD